MWCIILVSPWCVDCPHRNGPSYTSINICQYIYIYIIINIYTITVIYSRISWVRNMWWSSKSRSDRSATEVRPLPSSPYIFEALSERSASRCACATTTASWTIQNHWQGIPKSTDSSFFSLFKCHFMRYTGNPISRQISKIIKNPKMSQVSSLIRICIQESLSVVAPWQGFKQSWWSENALPAMHLVLARMQGLRTQILWNPNTSQTDISESNDLRNLTGVRANHDGWWGLRSLATRNYDLPLVIHVACWRIFHRDTFTVNS